MRHRFSSSLLLASVGLFLVACGGGESETADDMPAAEPATAEPEPQQAATGQLPEGVTQAMVEEGRTLFNGAGTCFACHGMDGVGSTLGPDMTDGEWLQIEGTYESIVEQIKTGTDQPVEFPGVMLPRAGTNITDAQVEALAAYIYSLNQ